MATKRVRLTPETGVRLATEDELVEYALSKGNSEKSASMFATHGLGKYVVDGGEFRGRTDEDDV